MNYKSTVTICLLILAGCTSVPDGHVLINGEIVNGDNTTVTLNRKALHYKYSPQRSHPVQISDNGHFSLTLESDTLETADLVINEFSYPIVLQPDREITVVADLSVFPLGVEINGYENDWNRLYQTYLENVTPVEIQIQNELPAHWEGEPNRVMELYNRRIELAQRYLSDSPLESVYHRNVGEYLNRALLEIRYLKDAGHDPDEERLREEIFEFADTHEFFTLESLRNQRAGIRDFTHYYAMSFDVQDSLRAIYGDQLAEQDIKRLGYEQLNEYRTEVLGYIPEEQARAYADLHLVAERLGELPLEISEPELNTYLNRYNVYEDYTSFLRTFYNEITAVSPGEPAVPFTLPDQFGNSVSMSDFDNKYVLLDFWASWCVPCLEEFPHMARIYENTPRELFEIVSISIEADSLLWRSALEEYENSWVQLYAGEEFQQETFQAYQGGGIPFYILINPEGRIERYNDIRATFNLESVLDSLLTNHPPQPN